MFLKFVYGNSNKESLIDMNKNFEEDLSEYDRYSSYISIKIYDTDNDSYDEDDKLDKLEIVAIIQAQLFNMAKIEEDGEDIVDIADMYDQEVYDNIYQLYNSKFYDANELFPSYICNLERLYIMPKYRQKDIGGYLLKNLPEIIKYYTNSYIDYIVLRLRPLNYENGKWEQIKNDSSKMLSIMKYSYKKAGYKPIRNTNWFVRVNN